jgi:hypothetical protein
MNILLILIGFAICSSTVMAQPDILWSRTYPQMGSGATYINEISQDEYVLGGFRHLWVNSDGDSLSSEEYKRFIFASSDDGIFRVRAIGLYGLSIRVQKYDALDSLLWEVNQYWWMGTVPYAAAPTPDGGCVLACVAYDFDDSHDLRPITAEKLVAWKLNADGEEDWVREWDLVPGGVGMGPFSEQLDAISVAEDGSCFFGGYRYHDQQTHALLIEISPGGSVRWLRNYALSTYPRIQSVAATDDGGCMMVGTANFGDDNNVLLARIDTNGDLVWDQTQDRGGREAGNGMILNQAGDIVVAGYQIIEDGESNGYLMKLTPAGETLWTAVFGTDSTWDRFEDLVQSEDGSYYICGTSGSHGQSFWLLKTEPDDLPVEYKRPVPNSIQVLSVYPNPFNSTATIRFQLGSRSNVKLDLYDLNGRLVSTLSNQTYTAGEHSILMDGSNLASGSYFVQLTSAKHSQFQKLVLLK